MAGNSGDGYQFQETWNFYTLEEASDVLRINIHSLVLKKRVPAGHPYICFSKYGYLIIAFTIVTQSIAQFEERIVLRFQHVHIQGQLVV
jgi:phytoene dehydrogenase-like protein